MSDFVHLHVHTQYSLLDGFSDVSKLVKRAKELEMPALGITDHGTMFGVIDFFNTAKKEGIKPIIGIEAYMSKRGMRDKNSQLDRKSSHLLLLAENQTGYQNLLKIASASQLDGFYYNPRIDHEFLAAHSEGLICTSGCMAAEVPRAILQDNPEEAVRMLDWYYEVFGPDNFYIELQSHEIPELPALNKNLIDLGARHKAKFVATNDVHYINQQDARLQDIMLCVQTGSLVREQKRMKMSDDSYYLKTQQEMAALFADIPGAISNTVEIAERSTVDLSTKGYKLPKFDVPEGYTVKSFLNELCEQGLRRKYGESANDPEIQERLNYELGVIEEMGFNAYFLIVWDLCRFSQEHGIWYNARGSAAGSIVAYSLDITLVDPIEHGLIFERFLNPGRISMPDIDLDFQDDLRYKIMEYCAHKYGSDKVAAIITFGKMKARASIRDVGRVLDIPISEVDRIAKMIPNNQGNNLTISEALEKTPDLKKEYDTHDFIRELIDTAKDIEGSIRNAGTHAAGVVISDVPVVDYIPLHRPTGNMEDTPIKTVTQFEMSTIDALGLLKVDFLGLSTLTILQRACEMIKIRHGVDLNLYTIPLDDPKTYEMLGRGDTAGVFQLEGAGMTGWVMKMKPTILSHVIAMVALYRPGPMEFIPSFIKRMHGEEEIQYTHDALKPILEETFGITVYQEQIMYTAMQLGGFTASEADFLRKAVAKKKEKDLLKNRELFINGAVKNDIPLEAANQIFNDWVAFARYGFPKGHAADYAVISVETAYLKANYPVEYMTALLSVTKGDSDKVAFYIADCRNNLDIDVLPPDLNMSKWDFTIEEGSERPAIRFGMGAVKNVGQGPVEAILEAREENHFESMIDMATRLDFRKVGKRAFESLIKAGALDSFGPRMAIMDVREKVMGISTSQFQAADAGQLTFFGSDSGVVQEIVLPEVDNEFNKREQLDWERELVGLFLSDHPLSPFMNKLSHIITHTSSQLSRTEQDDFVRVAGMVARIRPHITKKGAAMAFVGLEDTQGVIDLVVFPRVWKKYSELLEYDKIVIVEGRIDAERGEPKILVDNVKTEMDVVESAGSPEPEKKRKIVKETPQEKQPPPVTVQKPVHQVVEEPPKYEADIDAPPPPDTFPEDWHKDNNPEDSPEIETPEPAMLNPSLPEDETEIDEKPKASPIMPSDIIAESAQIAEESKPEIPPPLIDMPFVEDKRPVERTPDGAQPSMVTVVLRSMGDKVRDILRMRRIHGMLISYPGHDRFAFYVIEKNSGYRMEFPNDTTDINGELRARLEEVVGSENVLIEPITYQ